MIYGITITQIWNGYMEVEADSEDEALEIARNQNDEAYDLTFGETTFDDVVEVG